MSDRARGELVTKNRNDYDTGLLIDGLINAEPLEDIAARMGKPVEIVRQQIRQATTLTAVVSGCMANVSALQIPAALKLLSEAMAGHISYLEYEGNEKKIHRVKIKPETRIAAAQAVLKIAKLEEAPIDPERRELSTLTAEQLRDAIGKMESRLADLATPVDAPDVANASDVSADKDLINKVFE